MRPSLDYLKAMTLHSMPLWFVTIPTAQFVYFIAAYQPHLVDRPVFWAFLCIPIGAAAFVAAHMDR